MVLFLVFKGISIPSSIVAVSIYIPTNSAGTSPTDIKREIDSNTIIVGDFNTPLTPMDSHQNRKLIRKDKS